MQRKDMPSSRFAKPFVVTISSLFLSILGLPALCSADSFKVTKIYDGDTIRVQCHDAEIRVRLAGIDAPELCRKKREMDQPFGRKAKEHLEKLILNKEVNIISYGYSRHDLLSGTVLSEGKNINLQMLQNGFAEVHHEKCPGELDLTPYHRAEREARQAGSGIWARVQKYTSPSVWRKLRKAKSACAMILYGVFDRRAK
jgi:micrococcal nuclease